MSSNKDDFFQLLDNSEFSPVKNEVEFYHDMYVTSEQAERDKQITILLKEYVNSYKRKVAHTVWCRYLILIPCLGIVIAFAFVLCAISSRVLQADSSVALPDLAAFVTACISFVSLIITLLTIVTKYFFPENDEQYITKIVESIQQNDLENKRENAKHPPSQDILDSSEH